MNNVPPISKLILLIIIVLPLEILVLILMDFERVEDT